MLRLAVVIAVAGLLLADPILCRAETAGRPCAASRRSLHGPSDSHPGPTEAGPDSAHGCICQGATSNVDGKSSAASSLAWFAPLVAVDTPIVLPWPSEAHHIAFDASPDRPDGRAIRIERQSFLI